jgi:competence protein ComEA
MFSFVTRFVAPIAAATLLAFAGPALAALDVNRATQAELETVPGIGPAMSGKILAARQSASFKDWADLTERVGGVGPGNAKKFSVAGLTVAGSAFDASKLPAAEPKREKAAKAPKAEAAAKAPVSAAAK